MRCPLCVEQQTPSRLHDSGGGCSTCMGSDSYYDEEGRRHWHDPNANMEKLWCSNGHELFKVTYSKCGVPGCEFGRADDRITVYDKDRNKLGTFTLEGVRVTEEK